MSTVHVDQYRYGCFIKLHRLDYAASDAKIMHHWCGFKLSLYSKYKWYFRYRAALLQVKYPKQFVEFTQFSEEVKDIHQLEVLRLRNKIKSCKGKITEFKNKVQAYEKKWNSLFPISQDERYLMALTKIENKQSELVFLERQLEAIEKK